MRLTLRTLLAYLDDVLEPAETREIGRKIQESPLAAAQMSRIREVIRRRRLGAPDLDGPSQGIEPNLVAEYLDNALGPEQVADLERVCLESDVQLAEVAACHQILTLVLGEPQDVPYQSLDRFYALGPVAVDGRLHGTNGEPPRSMKPEPLATKATLITTGGLSDRVPDYLKSTPWTQRFGPILGVAVVLLAAVGALMLDRDLARTLFGEKPAVGDRTASTGTDDIGPSRPASPVHVPPETTTAVAAVMPATGAATLPAGIDPAPPPDTPETKPEAPVSAVTPATTKSEPTTVAANATPVVALPTPPKPALDPAPLPLDPVKPRVVVPMKYMSNEGVLIRYEAADQHWYVQPRRSEVHAEERFACPDPYEAAFDLDNSRALMTMLGDSVVEILPASETQRLGLRVHRGRVILQRGPAGDQPVSVAVAVDQQTWTLELPDAESTVGIEVRLRSPYRAEPPMEGAWYQAAAFVGRGSVRFLKADANVPAVTAGSMRWLMAPAANDPQSTDPLTAVWLDPQQRQTSATLRRYATLFEKEFDPATAVDLSIPALVKDPRPKIAELAVRCLAVTESYPNLVTALVRSEHAEARQAAVAGLRAWLVQSADRQALLKQELSMQYPGDEALPVYRLLLGFTPQEGKDKLVSMQLVDWLRSNYVEVRELAIGQLERLANRRYDYRPLGTPSQREPGIQRWLAHIEREGAIVKPE
ncbi:MAG: hypothetical protein SH850_23150 [Planctomycetaceae bacterium]|nr:hypothetical protein [Planctomycetaceae bacterium]